MSKYIKYIKYICLSMMLLITVSAFGTEWIANSKHDLSVQSPNEIRAVNEERICIFCHTPHDAQSQSPLWNRHSSTTYYRIYQSSTTNARIDQPSGPSKMCLSCHDGLLAVGLVRSRPATDPIPMTVHTMPPGPGNLGTDLSDDHPIGLRYDRALSNVDPQLRDPQLISQKLKLGPHNELHCTACHDPHDNQLGDFLRVPVKRGVLCTSCHQMFGWPASSHANSPRNIRSSAIDPSRRLEFASMADNACLACHEIHGAQGRERLLRSKVAQDNCLTCHDGSAGADILSTIRLPNNHRGSRVVGLHDPTENPRTMPRHVECNDCHNPHAARSDILRDITGANLGISNALLHVPGVSIHGRNVPKSKREYEICLRCHGDNPVKIRGAIERVKPERNLRRQISLSAASSHPFIVPGDSSEVPSLIPEQSGRRVECTDCHNSNNARSQGGSGPEGPHGSIFEFLVGQRYETSDFTAESASAYALCYSCHSRSSILADESFSVHRRHIVAFQAPCSACHDPHGVVDGKVNASHLINFDSSIVTRSTRASRIEYRDRGLFQGSCTLLCHGVDHVNFSYSP